MKRVHQETGEWLDAFGGLIELEIRLAAAQLHSRSSDAPFDAKTCELLAAVIFILHREHAEAGTRLRELFGKPGSAQLPAAVTTLFGEVDFADSARCLRLLHGSIASRLAIVREHCARFDGQTRLLLELHACTHDGVTLPMIRRISGDVAGSSELRALYETFLPAGVRHPDDFL